MEKYNNVHQNRREMMLNNFLGGISWALGATIGLSLIVAILTIVAKQINFIPIIGSFVADVINYILHNRSLHA